MPCVIETPRLRLRHITPGDLDFLAAMLGHPEVMRHYPSVLDRDGAAAWLDRQLQRYARDGFGPWLVEERASGEPVGQVGPARQALEGDEAPSVEVGYLLHRAAWGRGFATEAARASRDWVFAQLRVPRVISLIRPENVPSQRVAERNGFRIIRQVVHAGLVHDVWGTERDAWLAAQSGRTASHNAG